MIFSMIIFEKLKKVLIKLNELQVCFRSNCTSNQVFCLSKKYYVACIPGHKEYLPEQQFQIKKLITLE